METDFLKAFGLTEEQIAEVIKENGKDVEAVKGKLADYDTIKLQLAEAGKTIEGFKAMDIDAVRAEADKWKTAATKAEQDAAAKIAEMQFNTMLDSSITAVKGKNVKAIRALLDMEAISKSKNQSEDITKALEALKADSGYLFDSEGAPPPRIVGGSTGGISGKAKPATKEAFKTMSYRDRAQLQTTDPALYNSMKE